MLDLLELPDEILAHLLGFTGDAASVVRFSGTCRRTLPLREEQGIWAALVRAHFRKARPFATSHETEVALSIAHEIGALQYFRCVCVCV